MNPSRRLLVCLPLPGISLAHASAASDEADLTIPVPNALADEVVRRIRAGQ
jgi:hypothetical protein